MKPALTREEHDRLMVDRTRPITQDPIQVRAEVRNSPHLNLSPIDRIIAEHAGDR